MRCKVQHAWYNVKDAADTVQYVSPMSKCQNVSVSNDQSHLEFVLLSGVALAPDVLLQVHVVFERLSGGREGNRGQKLNHQTTKHTHGKKGGWKRKGEEREGGEKENRVSAFSSQESERRETIKLLEKKGVLGPSFKTSSKEPRRFVSPGLPPLNSFKRNTTIKAVCAWVSEFVSFQVQILYHVRALALCVVVCAFLYVCEVGLVYRVSVCMCICSLYVCLYRFCKGLETQFHTHVCFSVFTYFQVWICV